MAISVHADATPVASLTSAAVARAWPESLSAHGADSPLGRK
jgi:hypothetical protein